MHDELRQVTVLFADIVGSTTLGEHLSPDEVKALIGECVSRFSRAVEEFGGTIQAYEGDGICAYFGVPVAHEDDPERAARAALRIVGVARAYAREVEDAWGISGFDVRVGINSGQAGVGFVGGAEPQLVAMGDTTNIASRLQGIALHGTIVVGAEAAERMKHGFELEPVDSVQVKGRTEPVEVWRLIGARRGRPQRAEAPLVGRSSEMDRMRLMLGELRAGRGQILILIGDSGLGKTRLISELLRMSGEGLNWLEGSCLSHGGSLRSGPFGQMLRQWLDVEEGSPEVAVRTKLRSRLVADFGADAEDVMAPLADLLGVHPHARAEADVRDGSFPSSFDDLCRAYRSWIERLSAERPTVVAIDDMHWADPSTRALAGELIALTDRAAVLLVAALRPDRDSEAWKLRLDVLSEFGHRETELSLGPIDEDASVELAGALLPTGIVDEDTMRWIAGRAEGNPLFLEELLRNVAQTAAVGESGARQWTLAVSLRDLIPSSLESLFVARLDRLPEGSRTLAQVAAVAGRQFPISILDRVGETDDIEGDLASLLRADIIREVGRYPELVCTFRHGLVQEAVLSSLTPARARDLYGRVGRAYQEQVGTAAEEHADLLAFYFYRSDDQASALHYLDVAADRAASVGANEEAARLLNRARKVAARLGDAEEERRLANRIEGLTPPVFSEHAGEQTV